MCYFIHASLYWFVLRHTTKRARGTCNTIACLSIAAIGGSLLVLQSKIVLYKITILPQVVCSPFLIYPCFLRSIFFAAGKVACLIYLCNVWYRHSFYLCGLPVRTSALVQILFLWSGSFLYFWSLRLERPSLYPSMKEKKITWMYRDRIVDHPLAQFGLL